jgi:hypothetical protein
MTPRCRICGPLICLIALLLACRRRGNLNLWQQGNPCFRIAGNIHCRLSPFCNIGNGAVWTGPYLWQLLERGHKSQNSASYLNCHISYLLHCLQRELPHCRQWAVRISVHPAFCSGYHLICSFFNTSKRAQLAQVLATPISHYREWGSLVWCGARAAGRRSNFRVASGAYPTVGGRGGRSHAL